MGHRCSCGNLSDGSGVLPLIGLVVIRHISVRVPTAKKKFNGVMAELFQVFLVLTVECLKVPFMVSLLFLIYVFADDTTILWHKRNVVKIEANIKQIYIMQIQCFQKQCAWL